ncbi:MAG TPA: aminotransferase class IV [Candidatus Paceibacterota bacterium]|jgi:branched-subunit amino acid aminotransferase/4-amino-4-deoxychorismate lyase|nr:aminotransferase class IV [Candidatus Paceibacterota bacterium]
MEQFCFLNGKIVPLSEGKVSVYDLGLLRGFGIYEGLVSSNRKPFMFADHMARMHTTAERMQLEIPFSDAEIERAVLELIEKNVPKGKEGLIRIIQTGGNAIEGIAHDPKTPTFYILVEEYVPPEESYVQNGSSIATMEHMRQFPEMKTTNYIQAVLLQGKKREGNLMEVLYVFGGRALECTGSNIFIVKNGAVATPNRDMLFGITRKVAIELANKEFPVEERDVSVDELFAADEIFITGSFKEIVPVVSVDGRTIGSGKPGPVSVKLVELFREFARTH